jgi:phytoene synthase
MTDDLDNLIKRTDPDRWLASRLIGEGQARSDVLALLAFDHELAKVRDLVSDALMGEIRLTWWSEALDEMSQGLAPRSHPSALALADMITRHDLSPVLLNSLIEARIDDLGCTLMETPEAVLAYVDATQVVYSALALTILAPGTDPHAIRSAARAYGVAVLLRSGRLSADLAQGWARGRIAHDLDLARKAMADLPVAAFPAIAHATLVRPYGTGGRPGLLTKSARIVWASLTGRV